MLNDFPVTAFQLSFKCTLLSLQIKFPSVRKKREEVSEIQIALDFLRKPDAFKSTLKGLCLIWWPESRPLWCQIRTFSSISHWQLGILDHCHRWGGGGWRKGCRTSSPGVHSHRLNCNTNTKFPKNVALFL